MYSSVTIKNEVHEISARLVDCSSEYSEDIEVRLDGKKLMRVDVEVAHDVMKAIETLLNGIQE